MSDEEKVKHIIAFLIILYGDSDYIKNLIHMSPDYLIEKWELYIKNEEHVVDWEMHKLLKENLFDTYCRTWGLKNED